MGLLNPSTPRGTNRMSHDGRDLFTRTGGCGGGATQASVLFGPHVPNLPAHQARQRARSHRARLRDAMHWHRARGLQPAVAGRDLAGRGPMPAVSGGDRTRGADPAGR